MLESTAPVLGTIPEAVASPRPFGIGACSINPHGAKTALSLYYVSPTVARGQGADVLPSWYVAAVPETEFEVCVTDIPSDFPSIDGVIFASGSEIVADLFVDGSMVDGYRSGSGRRFRECTCSRFVESSVEQEGNAEVVCTIRKFLLQKARAKETITGAVADEDAGSIVLQMNSGMAVPITETAAVEMMDVSKGIPEVSELKAMKAGKSIMVARNVGTETRTDRDRSSVLLEDQKTERSVSVFLRESFWLQSRRIIEMSGNPWSPNVPVFDGHLGKHEQKVEDRQPSEKKAKREATKASIRDTYDLTND